jgi:hypothetical protein
MICREGKRRVIARQSDGRRSKTGSPGALRCRKHGERTDTARQRASKRLKDRNSCNSCAVRAESDEVEALHEAHHGQDIPSQSNALKTCAPRYSSCPGSTRSEEIGPLSRHSMRFYPLFYAENGLGRGFLELSACTPFGVWTFGVLAF